ncbi:Kappa-carrageenase precursor [Pelotomaculum sp. FP]|uniref:hemoblobin-interacting domain-containing protein n=1 Tax=Pelotomaculum sp. FP TaxID=261474 RepID=UPI001104EE83|nr:Ig-like domain-containing protein [Pelotomaculum sp. FP]TEB15757.1 Kappa-carrageenase precursor [Pelotomaculum sp. FP]
MRIRSSWVFKLFLTVFSVLLLAGTVSLMAPADALAAGGDIIISGPGLNGPVPVTITQNQLRGTESVSEGVYLQQQDVIYSTINTWPTKSWYRGQGVKLTDLLDLAGGLKPEATQIRFTSGDNFRVTFTVEELLNAPRYRFPNFMSSGLPGHLPGDPSGKVLVDTIIAHRSFSAQSYNDILDADNFSRSDANHLLYGQRAVTQQTNARFAKLVVKIEVLTDPVPKWDNPTVNPAPGEVPAGTMVEMHSPFDDEDKVHYTLDGSDPTIDSPMYNWIAMRWWSSRSDDLDEINHKIGPLNSDTTIKAVVIGPGRSDSDIVTLEYQVPGVAVTSVSIAEDDQVLEVGQTNQLTAAVAPENATNKNVSWSTSNESVATVSETGLVTAVSEGTADITVTTEDGDFTDTITVTVTATTIDVLYDGTVALTPGETFTVTAYNSGTVYTVDKNTPLGALAAAATVSGFTYGVTDKNYAASGALLLDNVGDYIRDPGRWYTYVNDVYKDGYNNAAGALNLIELVNGDKVEFYYAAGIDDPTELTAVTAAAIAAVKTVVSTEVDPTDWTLQLSGAKNASVTKAYFEDALACPSSGHQVTWTDGDGNVWGGVPLWLLVAMVDDDPDVGPYHFNFNDDLAAQNYEVNIIAGDDWSATLDSADIARNDGYIVANTLNGAPLPLETESGKACWPLYLKGPAVFGGQQVGNIVRIELSGLPEPPEGWTLEMIGDVGDTITQEEFEAGLACTGSGHYRQWTDIDNNVWSGVPLWVLLGAVDDIETGSHWTFNDALAADGYTVKVVAGDDFYKTFDSADVAGSNDYIVANKCNGAPLTEAGPLRLVGAGVTKDDGSLGGSAVGNIVKIEIPELQTPPADPGSWNLALNGKISDVISQAEFEAALACPNSGHLQEWTDGDGNKWSGIPLWFLTGWVDDRQPHDYDANQATAGYTILVKAGDGYTKDFASADVAWSNDYIIANKCNDAPLTDGAPLRLVGAGVASVEGVLSGTSVGNIEEIELTSFETAQPIPEVRIIKYAEDRTTVLDEITVDYLWMQENLEVIGDGTTVYRYEGITNNPDDVWDAGETYPGGYKIENAVKGTRIKDLCELVGGMGAGTEIVLVAKDTFETRLPYSSIYTDPAVQARQGDAILAWWGDGEYVPNYQDGMRLFFTPDDHVYGQWDMHETLPSNYWHYYYDGGIQYPSCAGLSSKLIETIKIYSVPVGDWTLELDGRDIGGLNYDVSKTYFEQALACQFGANHKATYTDSEEQVWEGMPLWFLAGFVDDADQHSDNAFNDALATAGYQVVITASDGDSVTINSADIIRNSNYIIANSLNGGPIPESDDNWPLRLVGAAVTGSTSIAKIVSIELVSSTSVAPPALTADTDSNEAGQAIDLTFTDDAGWRAAIIEVSVDGTALADGKYTVSAGKITIAADVFTEAKDYTVVVKAAGYEDAAVVQTIETAPAQNPVYTVTPGADAAYTAGTTPEGINTMTVNDGVTGFKYFAVNITPVISHSGNETVVFTHFRNGSQLALNATRADFDQVEIAQAGFNVQPGDVIKVYIVDDLTNAIDFNPTILQ